MLLNRVFPSLTVLTFLALPLASTDPQRRAGLLEEEFRGTVLEVKEVTCPDCKVLAVSATLRSENKKLLEVKIAPKTYLDSCDFQLRQGDVVDISATRLRSENGDVRIATTLKRGNETLTLRDSAGRPMWESRRCARCGF